MAGDTTVEFCFVKCPCTSGRPSSYPNAVFCPWDTWGHPGAAYCQEATSDSLETTRMLSIVHGLPEAGRRATLMLSIVHGLLMTTLNVRYHSGGSMKLNAGVLLLAHMVYL